MDAPDPDPLVTTQEVELAQALVNLVRNAVRASPGGAVRPEAARAGDAVAIAVVNARPRQASAGRGAGMGVGRGAGMDVGALIARAIMEAHGGRLDRGDRPGGELAHFVHLPLAGAAAA